MHERGGRRPCAGVNAPRQGNHTQKLSISIDATGTASYDGSLLCGTHTEATDDPPPPPCSLAPELESATFCAGAQISAGSVGVRTNRCHRFCTAPLSLFPTDIRRHSGISPALAKDA